MNEAEKLRHGVKIFVEDAFPGVPYGPQCDLINTICRIVMDEQDSIEIFSKARRLVEVAEKADLEYRSAKAAAENQKNEMKRFLTRNWPEV